jgi:hypothetical protein
VLQGSKKHRKLHVIGVCSNPSNWKSRPKLAQRFIEKMTDHAVEIHLVEAAYGDRRFRITEPGNLNHLQLRYFEEIWIKENMINLGLSRLPSDWEYVAWIDMDIEFISKTWVRDTLNQLQSHMFVQLFQDAIDLGPERQTLQSHKGFGFMFHQGAPRGPGYTFWHPGYAWAARREAIDAVGGLLDTGVLGAGDHHMALALVHEARQSVPKGIHPGYLEPILKWEELCRRYIKRDVGFVKGTILHEFHGAKQNRFYVERWPIITKFQFNPATDLKRDWQGLWQLETYLERQQKLHRAVLKYNRFRFEDMNYVPVDAKLVGQDLAKI